LRIFWITLKPFFFAAADEKFAREASDCHTDIRLELKLAVWETAGKSLHNDNLTAARHALLIKVGEHSIEMSGGDYFIEDVVREFPRPTSLAQGHDKQTDTSKLVKVWKPKPGEHKLTNSELAVVQMVNKLWPDGQLDHKAAARNSRINQCLSKHGMSKVSTRTIERAMKKAHFG
jgi:hypothetical protein